MPNTEKPKNPSKYRDENIIPVSLVRLNHIERELFSKELLSLLSSENNQEKNTGIIIALCYALGITTSSVFKLKTGTDFTENFTHYKCSIRIHKSQWKSLETELHKFLDVTEEIELPLLPEITNQLNLAIDASTKSPVTLEDGLKIDRKTFSKIIRKKLTILRQDSSHFHLSRIESSLKSEIYSLFQNPIIAYLLTGKEKRPPPHTRYYYVPSIQNLYQTWITVQNSLWQRETLLDELPQNQSGWNGFVLKDETINDFVKKAGVKPNTKNLFELHNWFTEYTLSMFCWLLGHRGVLDPFSEIELIDKDSEILLIN